MTPVMRYSATTLLTNSVCAGGSKQASRFGTSSGMSLCLSMGRLSLQSRSICVACPKKLLKHLSQVDALEMTFVVWKWGRGLTVCCWGFRWEGTGCL